MKRKNPVIISVIIILFTACQSEIIFEDAHKVENFTWQTEDEVNFDVPIQDTVNSYNIFLSIRNTFDYSYSNIYMFVEYTSPNGVSLNDTVEYFLADKQGKWYGKGFGSMRTNNLLLRQNIRFPFKGVYSFRIEQAMREKQLNGISSVGLIIEEYKK